MELFDITIIDRGGPIMWLLLATSLFGFIVFVERTLFLHRGQIRTEGFIEGIKNSLRNDRLMEALALCEDTPGPVPGVVKSILLQVDASEDEMRRAAESAALVEIPILERRIGTIAAVARIAPLLGLLGTLLGMIQGFWEVETSAMVAYPVFGTLLGGLGQALLTTAVGLIIAIMSTLAHHFLHGRVRALVHDIEYSGHELIQFLKYELPRINQSVNLEHPEKEDPQ